MIAVTGGCPLRTYIGALLLNLFAWNSVFQNAEAHTNSSQKAVVGQCEFYVDAFGLARRGLKEKWLEGEIIVDKMLYDNSLPRVAAVVRYDTPNPQLPEYLTILAVKTTSGYMLMMPYNDKNPTDADYRRIRYVNLYVEYKNAKGINQRLYLFANEGMSPEDIFWDYPYQYRARGSEAGVTYVGFPSPIMQAKAACTGEKNLLPKRVGFRN